MEVVESSVTSEGHQEEILIFFNYAFLHKFLMQCAVCCFYKNLTAVAVLHSTKCDFTVEEAE